MDVVYRYQCGGVSDEWAKIELKGFINLDVATNDTVSFIVIWYLQLLLPFCAGP